MTKQELIDRVLERVTGTGTARAGVGRDELNKKTVGLVIDAAFAELGEYFTKAKVSNRRVPRFTYPGFGTFTKKERAARSGRDPHGEPIEIPARTTVVFAPGLELRGQLNRPHPAVSERRPPHAARRSTAPLSVSAAAPARAQVVSRG